jgi:nucleolar protein 4
MPCTAAIIPNMIPAFSFRVFGPMRYARVTMDTATGRSRGTGFVCFWNLADADKVVEQSNIIRTELAGATEAPVVRHTTPPPSPASQLTISHLSQKRTRSQWRLY